MLLRQKSVGPTLVMRIGFAFLILASGARWLLHPHAWLSQDAVDGVIGLLYGLAIACLLLSVRLRSMLKARTRRTGN